MNISQVKYNEKNKLKLLQKLTPYFYTFLINNKI